MKKTFLILSTIVCAGVSAYAQDFSVSTSSNATSHLQKTQQAQEQQAQVETPHRVDGGLVNAARKGNILQAINPFAPKRYGSGERYVYPKEHHPEEMVKTHSNSEVHKGWILFAFSW